MKIAQGLHKDLQFFLEPAHERTDVVFCPKAQRRRIDPPDVKFSIESLTEGLSDQKVSALVVCVPPEAGGAMCDTRGRSCSIVCEGP